MCVHVFVCERTWRLSGGEQASQKKETTCAKFQSRETMAIRELGTLNSSKVTET